MYVRSSHRALWCFGSALVILGTLVLASCQSQVGTAEQEYVILPAGDEVAGRQLFRSLNCHVCHPVQGDESFPAPLIPDPAPAIGGLQADWDAGKIATSIIAPSHTVRDFKPEWIVDGSSKMPNFNKTVTIQQLLDVVSFIESAGDGEG